MLNAIKYTRKEIKENELEDEKMKEFKSVMSLRKWKNQIGCSRYKEA